MNNWPALLETLVPRIGWTLVHSMWLGLLAAAALWIALRVLRDSAATKRYAACAIALTLTVAAVGGAFFLLGEHEPAVVVPTREPVAVATGEFAVSRARLASSDMIAPLDTRRADVLRYVVLAWLAGVALMTIRHVGGWVWLVALRNGKPLEDYQPFSLSAFMLLKTLSTSSRFTGCGGPQSEASSSA